MSHTAILIIIEPSRRGRCRQQNHAKVDNIMIKVDPSQREDGTHLHICLISIQLYSTAYNVYDIKTRKYYTFLSVHFMGHGQTVEKIIRRSIRVSSLHNVSKIDFF